MALPDQGCPRLMKPGGEVKPQPPRAHGLTSPTGSGVPQANEAGGGSQTAATARPRVRLISLRPQERLSMAPVTIARFVQELEKLKQVSDAEKLKPQEYDSRLARIIQELREKGLDADRAATTAALADAVKRGIITLPVQAHLQRRLGLT